VVEDPDADLVMKNDKIHIGNSRTEEQRLVMEKIQADGVCPFCRKHFETYHSKSILFETEHWIVTENAWPYENTKEHFLLVAKQHVTLPSDLSQEAWLDLQRCIKTLRHEKGLERGTLLMRFGDSESTGSTVNHLHAQIVVSASPDVPIVTRIG